ncbi:MAG: cyclic nucleotide-binding domain-containing protein [Terracidiphilus sp.]
MQPEKPSGQMEGVAARPLAEILSCPPETGHLLNAASACIDFEPGAIVFRQGGTCRGLYVVVSGQFLRKAERLGSRLSLGPARPGDLLELGAALGDGLHTYTLTALTPASVLMLSMEALKDAFSDHPPMRMRLLEELAREVSRGYFAICQNHNRKLRGNSAEATL